MDELDRLLVSDDTMSPSSGFAAGVMEAVTAAATAPPPLPFPWARFAVGVLTCAVSAAGLVWLAETEGLPRTDATAAALAAAKPQLEIAAATLFATFAALRVRRALSW